MASKKSKRQDLEQSKSSEIKKNNEKTERYLEVVNSGPDLSDDSGDEGEVRCFCNVRRETGEMVQCEVCAGWFHLKCLRMKEGVGVLNGRAFVCCFCLSMKVLELTRVVGELQGEMAVLKRSVKELKREKDELAERVMVVKGGWEKVEKSGRYGRMADVREKTVTGKRNDPESKGGAKSKELLKCGNRSPGEVGQKKNAVSMVMSGGENRKSEESSSFVKKNRCREYVGVRKLWGTRKKVSVEDVNGSLKAKFNDAEKIEVVRVIKEDSDRTRWWFWLKGEEEVLGRLDGTVLDEAWKIEKRSPFLGVASVRVLSR